jgi:alpha-N-arabinofuranosidase
VSGAHVGVTAGRRRARLADSRIDVLLDEPIGTIAPEIYGHFVEHLGGVVYDGIWVGETSRIPNVGGIRKALIDALAPIRPSVIRWPGGCFADSYDWRDGIGPRHERPRRTNFWINDTALRDLGNVPAKFEPNHFGTNEFIRFCRLVGAAPYLAVNVRSLPARAFFEWLEYCNSPPGSTTLAELREAAGERDPFGVKFWGIGNESWGCGGNFTPEGYADEYRRFATWAVPEYGVALKFIGAGPSGRDLEWTRRFFRQLNERRDLGRMWAWALHHYSSAPNGEAIAFDDTAWYDLLASANRMESLITAQWQVMGELDREHRIKLVVDEWGAWHRMTTSVDPAHLFGQQSTIRDALVAALTLDTFNRHADKVAMANIAQLVNCIQSLFLAREDQFVVTPTYHVFAMFAAHQGGRAVRVVSSAPAVGWRDQQDREQSLWGLNGSASTRDDTLVLTVTNPHSSEARDTEIAVRGATVAAVTATTLAARNVQDHNTFDRPRVVAPTTRLVPGARSPFVYRFPAASVTKLEVTLGV